MSAPAPITGLGCISAVGNEPGALWDALASGRSAVTPIGRWDASGWPAAIGAEIRDVRAAEWIGSRKLVKRLARHDVFGLGAARLAVGHSGLPAAGLAGRSAIYTGSSGTRHEQTYDFLPALCARSEGRPAFGAALRGQVHPFWLLTMLPNNVLAYAAIELGWQGSNQNFTQGAASSLTALIEAGKALRRGEAGRALVVGYDSVLEPERHVFYRQSGLLSSAAPRPFSAAAEGTVLGEGAGALVLESGAAADGRGAQVYGQLLGGATLAAGRQSLRRALQAGLADAGVCADDVGLVVAMGEATPERDAGEATAIRHVFPAGPAVLTLSWCLGHTGAAAPVLGALAALLAMARGRCPGIPGSRPSNPACRGLRLGEQPQDLDGDCAVVIGRTPGLADAAAVLAKAPGRDRQS